MIEIFDVLQSDGASVTVAEIAPEVCPRGLALELHVASVEEQLVAYWLLEDGRLLTVAEMGQA